MPRPMLPLRKGRERTSWDNLVWTGWPSCHASPEFWFQQHHWTVLDNLPRLSESPSSWSQTAEHILFTPDKLEYFWPLEVTDLSLFHARNITGVTHSLLSAYYSCQSLIPSVPCNTEKEEGRKDESPREARKDKKKKKEREDKAITHNF